MTDTTVWYRTPHGSVVGTTDPRFIPEGGVQMVRQYRVGEQKVTQRVDAYFTTQAEVTEWADGRVDRRENVFLRGPHGPNGEELAGDYCGYCGAFNGPNGEYRNGWDCCYCGGN